MVGIENAAARIFVTFNSNINDNVTILLFVHINGYIST